jgi:hypothetical protein
MLRNAIAIIVAVTVAVSIIVATAVRDNHIPVRYDCRMLMGGWHPDFPVKAVEECRQKGYRYDANSKTSN